MREDSTDSIAPLTDSPTSSVRAFLEQFAQAAPTSFLSRLFGRRPFSTELCLTYRLASAEVAVVDALKQLGSSWTILHALPVGRGNDDLEYVAVGPAGVYSITVRQHPGGAIWIDGGVLLVDGERMPHIRDAEFEAVRASQLMSEVIGSRVEVTPCLVVAGARSLTVSKPPRRVAVLATRNLRSWMKVMPTVLDADTLEIFRTAASEQANWVNMSDPDTDVALNLERFRMVQAEVNQARHTKLTWATGALVLAWLVALVYIGESAIHLFG